MNTGRDQHCDSGTSSTLLRRVRDLGDDRAWRDFVSRYWKLVYCIARGRGASPSDAEETAQDVFSTMTGILPGFRYTRDRGRFRGLLRTVTQRRLVDRLRHQRFETKNSAGSEFAALAEPPESSWLNQERRSRLSRALARVASEVEPQTFQAFQLYVLEGWPVGRVTRLLGVRASSVYAAKTRVLARLRATLEQTEAE